jgi:hypothetical protein
MEQFIKPPKPKTADKHGERMEEINTTHVHLIGIPESGIEDIADALVAKFEKKYPAIHIAYASAVRSISERDEGLRMEVERSQKNGARLSVPLVNCILKTVIALSTNRSLIVTSGFFMSASEINFAAELGQLSRQSTCCIFEPSEKTHRIRALSTERREFNRMVRQFREEHTSIVLALRVHKIDIHEVDAHESDDKILHLLVHTIRFRMSANHSVGIFSPGPANGEQDVTSSGRMIMLEK